MSDQKENLKGHMSCESNKEKSSPALTNVIRRTHFMRNNINSTQSA